VGSKQSDTCGGCLNKLKLNI